MGNTPSNMNPPHTAPVIGVEETIRFHRIWFDDGEFKTRLKANFLPGDCVHNMHCDSTNFSQTQQSIN